jgi:hypothetical protein
MNIHIYMYISISTDKYRYLINENTVFSPMDNPELIRYIYVYIYVYVYVYINIYRQI